jgi:hypothetical protein
MQSWTGIALARSEPGDDGMNSRLSTYLHPLAGRPLAWHTVSALAKLKPPPDNLLLVGGADLQPGLFGELGPGLRLLDDPDAAAGVADLAGDEPVLLVDARAPAIEPALRELLAAQPGIILPGADGHAAAALLLRDDAVELLLAGDALHRLAERSEFRALERSVEALVVRDRITLARVTRLIHDRTVERLMRAGATFLLPDSVLVDVDVQIGRDSVIYPGAVLEGHTVIGEETVVGPGCRIIDSWIGSGVELKGWNFVSRSSVRNRAILEPFVRRGFD